MERVRTWNLGTAHLVVLNDQGADGMYHKELMGFLSGLRISGMVFGFWECHVEFYDRQLTVSTRGRGVLSLVASSAQAETQA